MFQFDGQLSSRGAFLLMTVATLRFLFSGLRLSHPDQLIDELSWRPCDMEPSTRDGAEHIRSSESSTVSSDL